MSKKLTVQNFKGCRFVELKPSGSLVVIAGANGAGKSSFIDAFVELFDPKGVRLTPKPIHDGETTALAEYEDTDLGYRITRRWTKNDSGTLTVHALDGAKYGKPSELVREITGGLIFDPVAFLNMDEKKQRDALLAKVELPFDLDDLERRLSSARDARTEAGREEKRTRAVFDSAAVPMTDLDEEVSAQDLLDQIQAEQNTQRERESAVTAHSEAEKRVAEIEAQITRLEEMLPDARAAKERAYHRMSTTPDTTDRVAALRESLAKVDETNTLVRSAREYRAAKDAFAVATDAHAAAEASVKALEGDKRAGLAGASFPVRGLSVDDDGITFEGVPFQQVNAAMRRKVAFAVATSGDPKLKLVIVKDGDLLDADTLAGFREIADERGYTVLVERDRDESREVGFTIADGVLVEEPAS